MSPTRPEDGRSRPWRRPALAVLLFWALVVGLGVSQTVHAATRTWTGLGLTNNWSDASNWSGNLVPGAADVATFDATSSKNATHERGRQRRRRVDRRRLRRHDHPGAGDRGDRGRHGLRPGGRDIRRRDRRLHRERPVRSCRPGAFTSHRPGRCRCRATSRVGGGTFSAPAGHRVVRRGRGDARPSRQPIRSTT